jgi:hypothetical protein
VTYFAVSDLRLPFSSPPTTLRVKMEVFDTASTRVCIPFIASSLSSARTARKTPCLQLRCLTVDILLLSCTRLLRECSPSRCLAMSKHVTVCYRSIPSFQHRRECPLFNHYRHNSFSQKFRNEIPLRRVVILNDDHIVAYIFMPKINFPVNLFFDR